MAVTLTDLRTLYSEADATTGWNTGSVVTSEPTPVEATGCLGIVVSTATSFIYFTGGAVNMSGGTLVYVWINHRAALDTTANGGLQVMLGDGTNRIGFHVAGSDAIAFTHEQGPVGWQCLVIDTANLPAARTVNAGSFAALNLSAITQIGAGFKTLAKSVGGVNNCFIDAIRYGNGGLRITGGSSGDPGTWEQIAAADRVTTDQRGHGICRRLGAGVYGLQGPITFGSDAGTAGVYFSDANVTVVAESRGLSANRVGLTVEGNVTGSTTFKMSGSSIVSPSGVGGFLTASDVHNDVVELENNSIVGLTNGIALCANTAHTFFGNIVRACGQVNPATTQVRDCTFREHTGSGAVLWSNVIDLERCDFVANTYGTQHTSTTGSPFSYSDIVFSGSITADVNNTSGGAITINAAGASNPTTFTGTTTIVNSKTLQLTGLRNPTEVRVFNAGTTTEIAGSENVTTGTFSTSIDAATYPSVDISVIALGYLNFRLLAVSMATDVSIPVQQSVDRQYENP
jgi:hypothetical protein